MEEISKHIDWYNKSNSKIQQELLELYNEHESLKNQIIKLTNKLDNIEKEYLVGNKVLSDRLKGVK
tara:strand:+ start:908 stop:1105 length:198 start_codon:yes stop_codon:yes gene_type:complete